jgi:hypothetical protein
MHTGKGSGAVGVRSEKFSHAKKHEKRQKSGPPRFSDNPKYPPKKKMANTDNYSGCSFALVWIMLSFV